MRTAAYGAGLINTEDSRRLLLALEPESACIACDIGTLVGPGQTFMYVSVIAACVTRGRLQTSRILPF